MNPPYDIRMKYSVLFGFRKADIDDTGYLKVLENGSYTVVEDPADATRLDLAKADSICSFFNDDFPEWKFHPVTRIS